MRSDNMREVGRLAVVVLAISLLGPQVVTAAGEAFMLKDADSATKAQVDNGKLRVGDGQGAIDVRGDVNAQPAPASKTLYGFGALFANSEEGTLVFQNLGLVHPTSRTLHITSLTFANRGTESVGVEVTPMTSSSDGLCEPMATLKTYVASVSVPPGDTVHLTFPQPYAVGSENFPYCLVATRTHGPTSTRVEIGASGYWQQ